MVITVMDRPDLVKVKDLITDRESSVAADLDEFYVEKIIGHTGTGKNPKRWQFRVRWRGYEPEDDTMLDWAAVKDLAALDDYSKENPHLKLG